MSPHSTPWGEGTRGIFSHKELKEQWGGGSPDNKHKGVYNAMRSNSGTVRKCYCPHPPTPCPNRSSQPTSFTPSSSDTVSLSPGGSPCTCPLHPCAQCWSCGREGNVAPACSGSARLRRSQTPGDPANRHTLPSPTQTNSCSRARDTCQCVLDPRGSSAVRHSCLFARFPELGRRCLGCSPQTRLQDSGSMTWLVRVLEVSFPVRHLT